MLCLCELCLVFKIFCSRPKISILSVFWPRELEFVINTGTNLPNITLNYMWHNIWTSFFNSNFYFSWKSRIFYIKNITILIPFGFHKLQYNFAVKILFLAPDLTVPDLECNSEQHISLLYGNMKLLQPYLKNFLSVRTDRRTKLQAWRN